MITTRSISLENIQFIIKTLVKSIYYLNRVIKMNIKKKETKCV